MADTPRRKQHGTECEADLGLATAAASPPTKWSWAWSWLGEVLRARSRWAIELSLVAKWNLGGDQPAVARPGAGWRRWRGGGGAGARRSSTKTSRPTCCRRGPHGLTGVKAASTFESRRHLLCSRKACLVLTLGKLCTRFASSARFDNDNFILKPGQAYCVSQP